MVETAGQGTQATPRRRWTGGRCYSAEEPRQAAAALGLPGFWAGYVVFRAAPLGPVGPAVVTAAFHGFGPSRAAKVLPAAWDAVSPARAIEERTTSTAAALRAICDGAGIGVEHVTAPGDAL